MQVEILIRARPTGGTYLRYHGLIIDEDLDRNFWTTQPNKIIATTSSAWYREIIKDLSEGEHYIIYGNSEYSQATGVQWSTNIALNGSLIVEEALVDINNPLKITFKVSKPPTPRKFNWWWLLLLIPAIIGAIGVQSTRKKNRGDK